MYDNSISIVVPLYNEAENVGTLLTSIHEAMAGYADRWELLCIDDGSSDNTLELLADAAKSFGNHVRVIALRRNFGQTAAMQAGLDHARGAIVVTMDGDLQNDPADIPRMAARLQAENLDLLVGWRRDRKDPWLRNFFSRVANRLIGRVTGVRIHDYGCSLKVFRGEVIGEVHLFGEMHRFIPVWVALLTAPNRIQEEVVTHHPRTAGTSKYGFSRTWRVILDLLSAYFFLRFLTRPAHFFGNLGMIFGGLGSAGLAYLAFIKFALGQDIGQRPLLLVSVLFVLVSIQLITTGLIGELAARIYFSSTGRKPYLVRERSSTGLADAAWHIPQTSEATERPPQEAAT